MCKREAFVYETATVGEGEQALTVNVVQDEDPINPREWSGDGELDLLTVRDRSPYFETDKKAYSFDAVAEEIENKTFRGVYLTLTWGAGSQPWQRTGDEVDRAHGILYIEDEALRKNYGPGIVPTLRKKGAKLLEGVAETLQEYINGEVYGYWIKEADGSVVDSGFGFMGGSETKDGKKLSATQYCLSEGIAAAKGEYERRAKAAAKEAAEAFAWACRD